MKINKPATTVDVCDRCHRESLLTMCIVCGAQFCLACRATMCGSWVSPTVCRDCADREDVQKLVACYSEELTPIFKRRHMALKRLGRSTKGA